jgi:ATP synthase protein I
VFVIVLPAKTQAPLPQNPELVKGISPSMAEYQQLKNKLMLWTLYLVGIGGGLVGLVYGTTAGQSFWLGGIVGIAYLRMLARSVEQLGENKRRLGIARFGLFIALMLIASKWQSLELLPAFFGFLTYKLAVLALMLRDLRS